MVSRTTFRPNSIDELRECLLEAATVRVSGSDSHALHRTDSVGSARLELAGLSGIVDVSPDDQVATLLAGTSMQELEDALRPLGAGLPRPWLGTVGGAISLGGHAGYWRDSVLGLTAMLADGRVVRFGSRAVKNVAGYDGHKLLIGSRGSLGIVLEVHLRLRRIDSTEEAMAPLDWSTEVDPKMQKWMRRTKEIFDPQSKLNPGIWGFI